MLFGIHKARNSGWGLVLTFALTGFMGYTLGPLLNFYLSLNNGAQLVTMALGMTALVFFGLSAYAIMTRKDFSFLSGFILAGFVVLLCAVVASFFVQIGSATGHLRWLRAVLFGSDPVSDQCHHPWR